jgi:hypothetical protein
MYGSLNEGMPLVATGINESSTTYWVTPQQSLNYKNSFKLSAPKFMLNRA